MAAVITHPASNQGNAQQRTLPHDLDAERSVLGAILIENETYAIAASIVDASMFFRDAHRRTFVAIQQLARDQAPIDLITLNAELERVGDLEEAGGPAYIAGLVDGVPRSTNVEYYAQIVREKHQHRDAIFVANRLVDDAYRAEQKPDELIGSYVEKLGGVTQRAAERSREWQIQQECHKLDAQAEARRRIARREAGDPQPPAFCSIGELIAKPFPEVDYVVEGLWPAESLVLLVAQGKAGKTTLRNNLIRSMLDGVPFMGRLRVRKPGGRIVVFDMELSERLSQKWFRECGIRNVDDCKIVHLKHQTATFNLLDPKWFSYWVEQVRAVNGRTIILDTLKPGIDACGLKEREDGGRFLNLFNRFIAACGATDGMICHHMGWSNDRARGDSALLDVPDVTWQLTRDKDDKGDIRDMAGQRYFSAFGRDVLDFSEKTAISFERSTYTLTLADTSYRESEADRSLRAVCAAVAKQDGPSTATAITAEVKGDAVAKGQAEAAIKRACGLGYLSWTKGPSNSKLHSITEQGRALLAGFPVSRSFPATTSGNGFPVSHTPIRGGNTGTPDLDNEEPSGFPNAGGNHVRY